MSRIELAISRTQHVSYLSQESYCLEFRKKKYFFSFINFIYVYIRSKDWSRENFRHLVLMDLYVLRCPKHDWTLFRKYLSVCLTVGLAVCMFPKFYESCISRTNARKMMKLYIQLHLDIIWCWLDFGVHISRSSDVDRNFEILL